MAKVKTTKRICDICGSDTNGFYYYEVHTNVFGVIAEMSLWIDSCEQCTKRFRYSIPNKLYKGRYDREKDKPSKEELETIIEELREIVESSTMYGGINF